MRKLRPYRPTSKELLNKEENYVIKIRGRKAKLEVISSTVNSSSFPEAEMQNQKENRLIYFWTSGRYSLLYFYKLTFDPFLTGTEINIQRELSTGLVL